MSTSRHGNRLEERSYCKFTLEKQIRLTLDTMTAWLAKLGGPTISILVVEVVKLLMTYYH